MLSDTRALSKRLRDIVLVSAAVEKDDCLMPIDRALEDHETMTIDGVGGGEAHQQSITEEVRRLIVIIVDVGVRDYELREVEPSCC